MLPIGDTALPLHAGFNIQQREHAVDHRHVYTFGVGIRGGKGKAGTTPGENSAYYLR
jgi:hypothetical protein